MYISDLRFMPWLKHARKEISGMDLSIYSLREMEDAAEYLYFEKRSFADQEAAIEYFRQVSSR